MDDIAKHIVKAIKSVEDLEDPPEFNCNSEDEPWPFGAVLQDKILQVSITLEVSIDVKGKDLLSYQIHII